MRNPALRLKARLSHARARIGNEPLVWTCARILRAAASLALWLMLLPLAAAIHLAGARRIPVITQRIGHLAAEVDCFLKERALGQVPARRWFIVARRGHIANRHLLSYWAAQVRVIDHPVYARLLQQACRPPVGSHDIADYVLTQHGAARYGGVNARWGTRGPLLELNDADRQWGEAALAELGLPRDAWFVCVHPRTPGYASHDDRVHAYRNSSPTALIPAITAIGRRGGWCVQMGDPSAPRLPPQPNLIDYAHHRLRSERLDVILCARCRFFLGSSSGLFVVSTVFGVRSALANLAPIAARPYAPGDLYIPKLYRSIAGSRELPFAEAFASPLAGVRHSGRFREAGIELVENTADEIVDLVEEMLESLSGRQISLDEDERAFDRLLEPHHYGFGSRARISRRFLARHRDLISAVAGGGRPAS